MVRNKIWLALSGIAFCWHSRIEFCRSLQGNEVSADWTKQETGLHVIFQWQTSGLGFLLKLNLQFNQQLCPMYKHFELLWSYIMTIELANNAWKLRFNNDLIITYNILSDVFSLIIFIVILQTNKMWSKKTEYSIEQRVP